MDWMKLAQRAIDGHRLEPREAQVIVDTPQDALEGLLVAAERLREHYFADKIWFCSIVNSKSGACPEDCAFCAQSARHHTAAAVYPMKSVDEILECATQAHAARASEFCIVTSGTSPRPGAEFDAVLQATAQLRDRGWMKRCCSLGALSREQARQLKAAGLQRTNHNVETAREFYPRICSTHTWEDRVRTIENLKAEGLEVCSGGIIGMGEEPKHWIAMAFELRELEVDSIPLNFLNPVAGTPLGERAPLEPWVCLKVIALFRFANPRADIRICGGREVSLREAQRSMFRAGANATMIGDYLTTKGRPPADDLKLLEELNLKVADFEPETP